MQHTSPFLSINNSSFPSTSTSTFPPNHHHHHHHFPSFSRSRFLHYPILHSSFKPKTTLLLPPIPPKTPHIQSISPPPPNNPHHEFQEKMLYLDSIGIDFSTTINNHPPVISTPLSDIKSTVDYMISMEFTLPELRRIVSMCPELLSSPLSRIIPVFTFLLREVRVDISDLKRVINRRPRLLACSVKHRLRPTLYFIQSIGISDAHRHTYLLSCSVEDKLILRIEFFEKIGFCHRDAISMFRRFPQLFNYSVKDNYEAKLNYFVMEMGRDLKEIKEFPQYFSFSLENRIKPRHQCCVEKGLCFPLSVLLKSSETQFRDRMEVCCSSSMPFRTSPLSTTNCCYIQTQYTLYNDIVSVASLLVVRLKLHHFQLSRSEQRNLFLTRFIHTTCFYKFVLAVPMAARGALLNYLRVNVNTALYNRNHNSGLFSLCSNVVRRHFSEEVKGSFLDKSEVTDRIVDVVKKFQKIDPSKVTPDAHFKDDFGLDSLDTVEVVMALEEEFGFEIPDNEADKISSIKLAVDFISSHPQAK